MLEQFSSLDVTQKLMDGFAEIRCVSVGIRPKNQLQIRAGSVRTEDFFCRSILV